MHVNKKLVIALLITKLLAFVIMATAIMLWFRISNRKGVMISSGDAAPQKPVVILVPDPQSASELSVSAMDGHSMKADEFYQSLFDQLPAVPSAETPIAISIGYTPKGE